MGDAPDKIDKDHGKAGHKPDDDDSKDPSRAKPKHKMSAAEKRVDNLAMALDLRVQETHDQLARPNPNDDAQRTKLAAELDAASEELSRALFGVPDGSRSLDHARRALRGAQALRDKLVVTAASTTAAPSPSPPQSAGTPTAAGPAAATGLVAGSAGSTSSSTSTSTSTSTSNATKPSVTGATTSASVTAPTASQAGGTARPENKHFVEALLDVERYFRRQGELATALGLAAARGFEAFKIRSSAEFNRSSSSAMGLFLAALKLVPEGGELLAAFSEFSTATRFIAFAGGVQRLSKGVLEPMDKAVDAIEKTGAVGEKRSEASEGREAGEFQIETLKSLDQLTEASMAARWGREDLAISWLEALRYSDVDLKDFGKKYLGPPPSGGDLAGNIHHAAEEFEIRLYVDYYVKNHRVKRVTVDTEGTFTHPFEGFPRAVEARFDELHRWGLVFEEGAGLEQTERRQTWKGHTF